MPYTYKLFGNHPDHLGGQPIDFILRKEDGAVIPKNEENTDYQEYLSWVAEGNTPDPAD
tara:strand:+ start:552 stop:728 length:177 start_codon:yes stop_codon:yes gene_type:complete